MMTLVACGLLALGVLVFMISPMLQASGRGPWAARSRRDDLLKKKDFIYSAIRELNIDYRMGKLTVEDHEALRQEYMTEASDVLDELDREAGPDLTVEEQIEEAVLARRRSRNPASTVVDALVENTSAVENTAVDEKKTATARPLHPERAQSCGSCGTINEESANFCIACGDPLKRLVCGSCGAENAAVAKFCAQCGLKLN